MKDVHLKSKWSYFEMDDGQVLPLEVSGDLAGFGIHDLLLQGKDGSSVPLKNLVTKSQAIGNSEVYREKMGNSLLIQSKSHNLKKMEPEAVPTLWTEFLLGEFKRYYLDHLTYAVFIYLLLAIYLNSFVRSLFLFVAYLMPLATLTLTRALIPLPFHVDSLWMLPATSSLIFLILLVQTRIVDMERMRGVDRDLAISDLRHQMLTPMTVAIVPFLISLPIKSFWSISGFWIEGIFLFPTLLFCLWFLNRSFFPLFYLEVEVFVEKKLFIYYLWFRRNL